MHYGLPQDALFNLLRVSTGDSGWSENGAMCRPGRQTPPLAYCSKT